MNTHVYKMIYVIVLLLSAYTSRAATPSALPPTAAPILPTTAAAGEISPAEDVPQTSAYDLLLDRTGAPPGEWIYLEILCLDF